MLTNISQVSVNYSFEKFDNKCARIMMKAGILRLYLIELLAKLLS